MAHVTVRRPSPADRQPLEVVPGAYVKLHPELAVAALKAGKSRHLRVWERARALDKAGSGRVLISDLLAACRPFKGMAAKTVKNLLPSDSTFWTVKGDRLELRGLLAVALALGVRHLSPPRIAKAPVTLKGFRALCAFCKYAGDDFSDPVSQRYLGHQAGKTKGTVKGYIRALGFTLDKRENVTTDVPDPAGPAVVWRNGRLVRQLPNSYLAHFEVGPRGMTGHVNRRLRCAPGTPAGESRRTFYRNTRQVALRLQSLKEGDSFYCQAKEGVWTRFTIAGGKPWASRPKFTPLSTGKVFYSTCNSMVEEL